MSNQFLQSSTQVNLLPVSTELEKVATAYQTGKAVNVNAKLNTRNRFVPRDGDLAQIAQLNKHFLSIQFS